MRLPRSSSEMGADNDLQERRRQSNELVSSAESMMGAWLTFGLNRPDPTAAGRWVLGPASYRLS
jgi:hypothetical protein